MSIMYQLTETGVIRLSDNANIPENPDNLDWIEYLAWVGQGNTPAAIPVVVIQSVTMRQARLYLLQLGILDNIPIAIASISDANARAAAQIEWEYAGELHRDNPFVQQLAPAIGFDEADMDEFFQEASKL